MKNFYDEKMVNRMGLVTIKGTDIILKQMKNCICKIYKANGTGFFCYIPFENKKLRVMVTNYHVIDEDFIKENNIIKISLNDDFQDKNINLKIERNIYFNKEYDITMIELNDTDNIYNYLEIDENLFKDHSEIIYESNNSIYIIQYPRNDKASVSYGLLKEFDKIKKNNLYYFCNTEPGLSGSPILNLKSNKVIGIHQYSSRNENFNIGTFLREPIYGFIKSFNDIKKNNVISFKNNQIINKKTKIYLKDKFKVPNQNNIYPQMIDNNTIDNKYNKRSKSANNNKNIQNTNKNYNYLNNQRNEIFPNIKRIKSVNAFKIKLMNKNDNKINNANQPRMANHRNIEDNQNNNNFPQNNKYNKKDIPSSPNMKEIEFGKNLMMKVKIKNKKLITATPFSKGLCKIDDYSLMNATFQCLVNVEKLIKYLILPENLNKVNNYYNKYKLINSFFDLLMNLWFNNNIKYYSLNNLKNTILQINPLFKGIYIKEIPDILEMIQNELNILNNINQENIIKFTNINYNSQISYFFSGINNSSIKCLNCNNIINKYQRFNMLIFPLENVKNYKKRIKNRVDIYEFFEYYEKEGNINENQLLCNHCHRMVKSDTKLIITPDVLVIFLDREKGLNFDIKLNFYKFLDIHNYICHKDSPKMYELIGIIVNLDKSNHYISFCKSFVNNKWYKYNNTQVQLSSFEEASSTDFPIFLFYASNKIT